MNHHQPTCQGGPDCDCHEFDELIQDAINQDETPLSNCCGAPFYAESDLCHDCGEHAEAEILDFKFPGSEKEFGITYDPETRELIRLETVAQAGGRREG